MPLIRLISQSFRFCNFRLPNLNTKTRMWFGWEERHEQQTRYHFPFSLNPFRADSEANGTELSLHQPRFVGKAAAGDFFPNLNKFYFSFGVGCFLFFFYRKMSAGTENVHIRNARAHLSRRLRRFVVRFARFALGWRSHRPAPEENFSIWKISSKPSPTRGDLMLFWNYERKIWGTSDFAALWLRRQVEFMVRLTLVVVGGVKWSTLATFRRLVERLRARVFFSIGCGVDEPICSANDGRAKVAVEFLNLFQFFFN